MKGFSHTMSNLIFFIGAILAVSLAVSAIGFVIKQVQHSMDVRARVAAEKTETILDIVDGGYDGNNIWFYVKNTGRTNLEVNKFDIFVNSVYEGACNGGDVECVDETGNYVLTPDEIMEVNFSYSGSGAVKLKAVCENGSYAEGEVVIG